MGFKVPITIWFPLNLQVRTEDDGMLRLFRTLVHKSQRGSKRNWTGWLSTMAERPENRLKFAAKRIRGKESLIIATNMDHPRSALRLYRRRWAIECLFSDAKTRGFNIEDTHITDSAKLAVGWGTGARTMVTFSAPPLKFRTSGFPGSYVVDNIGPGMWRSQLCGEVAVSD